MSFPNCLLSRRYEVCSSVRRREAALESCGRVLAQAYIPSGQVPHDSRAGLDFNIPLPRETSLLLQEDDRAANGKDKRHRQKLTSHNNYTRGHTGSIQKGRELIIRLLLKRAQTCAEVVICVDRVASAWYRKTPSEEGTQAKRKKQEKPARY